MAWIGVSPRTKSLHLVFCTARPEALKPGPTGPSRARPYTGLHRAQGLGLKFFKPCQAPKPGLAGQRQLMSVMIYFDPFLLPPTFT
jgi:hypothetical protein